MKEERKEVEVEVEAEAEKRKELDGAGSGRRWGAAGTVRSDTLHTLRIVGL